MPLATNPNRRFWVTLESDAYLPEAERPRFQYRFLTGAEWERVAALLDGLDTSPGVGKAVETIFAAATTGLADWDRIVGPDGEALAFDPARLKEVLTVVEALELANKARDGGILNARDRKNFERLSPSAPGASAPSGAPDATDRP